MKREERFALFSFFENLSEIVTIYGDFRRLMLVVKLFEKKNRREHNDTKISHARKRTEERERERDSSVLENNNNNT